MPKHPVLTAKEAEKLLFSAGYIQIRSKGSHRIYKKDDNRFVLPYHAKKNLHPKIVKSLLEVLGR